MFVAATLALAPAALDHTGTLTREYMLCVRTKAIRLEPSGDSPEDVAKAAVFACQREEATVFAVLPREATQLRDTAIFYGTGQAVAARLCRKTHDCSVATLPK